MFGGAGRWTFLKWWKHIFDLRLTLQVSWSSHTTMSLNLTVSHEQSGGFGLVIDEAGSGSCNMLSWKFPRLWSPLLERVGIIQMHSRAGACDQILQQWICLHFRDWEHTEMTTCSVHDKVLIVKLKNKIHEQLSMGFHTSQSLDTNWYDWFWEGRRWERNENKVLPRTIF